MPLSRSSHLFLRLFLPSILLVLAGAGLYGHLEIDRALISLRSQESLNVGLGAGALSRNIEFITSDLNYLASHSALLRVVNTPSPHNLAELAEDLANFARSKGIYTQLRWLDETGMEVVRVDTEQGNPVVIAAEKLQHKGKRYFFTEASKLNAGEIYISPLDLNVEQEQIEVPHKPMIRLATPIFDSQGKRRGIVILNYNGRDVLDAFATAVANIADHSMVLNGEGYWLKSPNPQDEWGFMFKRADLSLGVREPTAWNRIRAEEAGQELLTSGLWTWRSVYPLLSNPKSSTGATEALPSSRTKVATKQYVWKAVAHLSNDLLNDIQRNIWRKLAGLSALLIGLAGFASWKLASARTAQEEVAAEVRQVNAELGQMVAELQTLNGRLTQTQNQLLQSEKLASIGLLAAGVAHEINNPIAFVNANLGALTHHVDDLLAVLNTYEAVEADNGNSCLFEKVRALKAKVDLPYLSEDIVSLVIESRDGLDRVKRIIQSLKDFSRVEAVDAWQEHDILQGIESTLSVVSHELKYNCEVRNECSDLPPVECVLSRLNQVFMNLLVNAAHAIEGHGIVTIRTGRKGDEVWLEVADTGKGIPAENLAHIFDPFFTTKPVGQGTGLGLSVSYGIVQEHHGRIEVESELGKGSTFRVWLPIRQPAATLSAATIAAPCAEAG